jgi:hypothetical protein
MGKRDLGREEDDDKGPIRHRPPFGLQAAEEDAVTSPHHTARNSLIHDEILMTFFYFVIDHTASMTNSQISS